jgi:hypothetical protein
MTRAVPEDVHAAGADRRHPGSTQKAESVVNHRLLHCNATRSILRACLAFTVLALAASLTACGGGDGTGTTAGGTATDKVNGLKLPSQVSAVTATRAN